MLSINIILVTINNNIYLPVNNVPSMGYYIKTSIVIKKPRVHFADLLRVPRSLHRLNVSSFYSY